MEKLINLTRREAQILYHMVDVYWQNRSDDKSFHDLFEVLYDMKPPSQEEIWVLLDKVQKVKDI
jgi:hypothetical protein